MNPCRNPRRARAWRAGLPFTLAAALGAVVLGLGFEPTGARADGVVAELRSGDTVTGTLGPGGIDAYRVVLGTGTSARLRLDAEPGLLGAAPTLLVLAPSAGTLASRVGIDTDVRITADTAGVHLVQILSATYAGEYELTLDTDVPPSAIEATVPPGASAEVRVPGPLGALIRLDVRRVSGTGPEVVSVRDSLGRSLPFRVARRTRGRVRLAPVPVTAPGGLFVTLRGRGDAAGTFRVTGKALDDGDDAPDVLDGEPVPRRIVVQLAQGADAQAVADGLGYVLVRAYAGFAVLETPPGREGREDEDARTAADSDDDVVGAEPDTRTGVPEGTQSNPIVLGSDLGRSEFDVQTAFEKIRVARAQRRASGSGVVVAVLDTGIDRTHSMFAGATILPGFDFVDDDDDPADRTNATDDDADGDIDEGFGHGTFVAGLVLGVAPDASILPVRVLDSDGRGSVSQVAAGIEFAVDAGADVINLSLGMRRRSDLLGGAVRYALANGVAVVAATGNGGETRQIDFPGGIGDVHAVTAVDADSHRPEFANAGGRTDIAAPGVDLLGPFPGERWGTWSGTSFAAALVSGTSALVLDRRPTRSPRRLARGIRHRARPLRGIPRSERRLLRGRLLDAAGAAR